MTDAGVQHELPVVLVIDDDVVSREVTSTVLTMGGYTVYTVEDGEAALKLMGSGGCVPEVILMDTQMPGLSGVELITALRGQSHARLFAMSGSRPSGEILAGVDGFLLKPFDCEALRQLIEGRIEAGAAEEAPALAEADEPAIRMDVMYRLRQMMPETAVREIYEAMVRDLAARIEALGVAIGRGNWAEIRRIGHAIKGGCGMAGAMKAASLGAQLEMVPFEAWDNRSDNSAALLGELRAALRRLESILNSDLPV